MVVIYHANCHDGMAAAWCFHRVKEFDFEFVPGYHGSPPPADLRNRFVFIADFSYPRTYMNYIIGEAAFAWLLDHHYGALKALNGLRASNFSMQYCTEERSGAGIAWEFTQRFFRREDEEPPPVLRCIEDRDLWRFALEDTRELFAGVASYKISLEEFDRLMALNEAGLEELKRDGRAILRYREQNIGVIIGSASRKVLLRSADGNEWPVTLVNAPHMYASDIGDRLSADGDIVATYYDSKDHRLFSLRSKGQEDVSKIAAAFGGSGHRNAAGFRVPKTHPLSKI